MDVRYRFIVLGLMFFLFEPVTLEVSKIGYTGDDIVLPCIHSGLNVKDMTCLWRFEDSEVVYDFIEGKNDLSEQEARFKNRTTLTEPLKGNFSLKLTNLKKNDGGTYTCYLPKARKDLRTQQVLLTIKEKTTEERKSAPQNSGLRIGPGRNAFLLISTLILILSV